MAFDKVNLQSRMRSYEINTINNIAKYIQGFNDSLLIESELDLDEVQLLENIFGC